MISLSSEDRADLTDAVRRVVQQHAPLEHARAPYDANDDADPLDLDLWHRLADDLGVVALQAPQAHGGQGCSMAEVAAVAGELGGVLARVPFVWSSGMVVSAMTHLAELGAGTAHVATLLGDLANGRTATTTITFPVGADGFIAVAVDAAWATVSGSARNVPWAGAVDVLLVLAELDGTAALLAVETSSTGLDRTHRQSLDRTVPLADVTARDVGAAVLARGDAATTAARFGADCGAVMLAAEMTGATATMLDRAVDYAKAREQFGKVIGAQQSIKHQLADVAVELELARAANGAAVAVLRPDADRVGAVATAKATSSEMFLLAADTCLHVHGGMGFTWEQESHLFLRRARFASGCLGSLRHHRDAYFEATCREGRRISPVGAGQR